MNPLYLEVLVVLLGIVLLIAEAFDGASAKRGIVYAGIAGLIGILAASFFIDPAAMNAAAPYARFYSADADDKRAIIRQILRDRELAQAMAAGPTTSGSSPSVVAKTVEEP